MIPYLTQSNKKLIVNHINVTGKNCMGCESINKDIMITFKLKYQKLYRDIFLSKEQALSLIKDISNQLKLNENNK